MREFLDVVTVDTALERIKKVFTHTDIEWVPLSESHNRTLADSISSPELLPAFTRSTVDGYAIRAQDSFGSSESLPAFLTLTGEVIMGRSTEFSLSSGECAWIPTGGMLPGNSDAVVMVEYTEKLDEKTVLIYRPVGPGDNTMLKGEDISLGQELFPAGHRLRPQDIGLMASLGITGVAVLRPIKVGIISTGDEIVPIEKSPLIGQVRDVNTYALAAAVEACGAIAKTYPIVKDDFVLLKQAMEESLQENDMVLISGGSSVGIADMTLTVLLDFPDSELIFHGVAVKPGKPAMAVREGEKLVIGLPGHPVSALMMFYTLCSPVLNPYPLRQSTAKLSLNVASQAGRDDYIPVAFMPDKEYVEPLLGKSGLMSILARADGYIHIPYEKQGIKSGESVKVTFFHS